MDNCYYEKVGNKTACIDNELPFSIPSKWMWIRLGELGLFRKGPFGSSLTKEMFVDESTLGRVKVYEQKNAIQKDFSLGKYYISKEKFAQMEGFIVNPGDIIVSCAGTIGEIYVLPNNAEIGIINQALMRIRLFVNDILDYFLLYFDFVLKKEANEKGNGTGMKNIPPFDILKKLLVPLPPINEINRILFFLKGINKNIDFITLETTSLNRLVELTKSKILEDIFGENSRYKSYYENSYLLGDILEYEQPAKYIVESTEYSNDYPTPVLTPGKTFILGYTNEKDGIYRVNGSSVIIFDDFTTVSRIVDFDFKVKSSAMKILTVSDTRLFDIEYLYYLLQTIKVNNNTHKRYWISEFATKELYIHTKEQQKEIVNSIKSTFALLDKMSSSI